MSELFNIVQENLKPNIILTSQNITPVLNPSSQVYMNLGSCLRQQWFDKTDTPKSNPSSNPVLEMSKAAGEFWENWLISKLGKTVVQSQILATDPKYFVKGFVDILTAVNGVLELGEIKTYDGSNYFNSKQILGSKDAPPTPKIPHLLQAFRYLLIFKDKVKTINLIYLDRSCSAWFKNYQFKITLFEYEGSFYPQVESIWYDEIYTKVYKEIDSQSLYATEAEFLNYLKSKKVPPATYKITYTDAEVQEKYSENLIFKTSYEKYQKDPIANPIGDYACSFCNYRDLCKTYD